MKSQSANLPRKQGRHATNTRAFTLTELMVTMAVFALVVIAMVSLQIFGFKINSLTQSKLKSTGFSLMALDQIRNQVRGAYTVLVGNGTGTSFTATGTNGNALQIYPTTNSYYTRVYLATNVATLYEFNSTNNSLLSIASDIINKSPFQSVNYQGNTSSTSQEHYAIKMTLQFSQLDYRIPSNTYEYYTLQTEMTPRTQN